MNFPWQETVKGHDWSRFWRWTVHIIKARIVQLGTDVRKAIELLNTVVEVVEIEREAGADEISAALHAEMPWMASARVVFWQAMQQFVGSGMLVSVFRRVQHSAFWGNKRLSRGSLDELKNSCVRKKQRSNPALGPGVRF
ncbi:hypothetical protein V6766_25190 [Martelella sp. AMO21009]